MAAPVNTTPATAIEITEFPFTYTEDVADAPDGTLYPSTCDAAQKKAVWFKYTATVKCISFRAYTNTVGYTPNFSFWDENLVEIGDNFGSFLQPFCDALGESYWELPFEIGLTYYFQITDIENLAVGACDLIVEADEPNAAGIPVGSLMIPEDTAWENVKFPATVVHPTTGIFIRFPDFPPGESAATLPDGTILTQNAPYISHVKRRNVASIYDSQLNFVTDVTFPSNRRIGGIVSNEVDKFYVLLTIPAAPGTGRELQEVSSTGVLGTLWTLPTSTDIAVVDRTDDYCYCAVGITIRKFDLNTSTDLGVIYAGVANETLSEDGGTLANGDIWFQIKKTSASNRVKVRTFLADGTLVSTYDGTAVDAKCDRAAYWPGSGDGIVDYESIWLFRYVGGNLYNLRLSRIKVSDMSITSLPDFPGMEISGFPGSVTYPDAQFACADSCPLIVLRVAIAAPANPSSGIYVLDVTKHHDTLYTGYDPVTTEDVRIPTPFAKLAYLGGE